MRLDTRRYAAAPAELPRGTLTEVLYTALDFGKSDALRYEAADGWRSLSHADVEERVRRLAAFLESRGVAAGDRTAILSENRPEWALADYATLCIGAISVPVHASLPAQQVEFPLRDSGARAAFVSTAEQLAKLEEVRANLPELRLVVVFDESAVRGDAVALSAALAQAEPPDAAAFRARALERRPEDIATIIYTSGTTGEPKGVMLTHDNVHSNTIAIDGLLSFAPDDVALSFLPLSHILQRMVDYALFAHGVTIAYVERLERLLPSFAEVRPTIVVSTPRLYDRIYDRVMSATGVKLRLIRWAVSVGERWATARLAGVEPPLAVRMQHALADRLVFRKLRERVGGRLKFFVSGGAPLNPTVARFFYAAGILLLEGYGLTETSPVTNVNTPDALRLGTVGKPIPGTEIMIADDGEILIRGPQVMKGYYRNEEATRAAIDEDGWFHTGDIGELDADGYLRITDRKKDLIVTAAGKNLAPQPIEHLVRTNRFVAEAVMIGDRRPFPVMLIVPNFEVLGAWAAAQGIADTEPESLVRESKVLRKMEQEVKSMLGGLARFETPRRIALLPKEFTIEGGELTPSLKVKRRVVEDRYREVVDGLYAGSSASQDEHV